MPMPFPRHLLLLALLLILAVSTGAQDKTLAQHQHHEPRNAALVFDGTAGQFLSMPSPPVFAEDGFTVEAWARFDVEPVVGEHPCLFSSMESVPIFQVSLTDLRRIQVVVHTAEGLKHEYESHNPQLTLKQWHHIAVMYHPIGGVRVAIDGLGNITPLVRQLRLFKGKLLSQSPQQPVLLGACQSSSSSAGSSSWVGAIANPRVWNKRMTVQQIRKSMFDVQDAELRGPFLESGPPRPAKVPHMVENVWSVEEPKARLAEYHADVEANPGFAEMKPRTYVTVNNEGSDGSGVGDSVSVSDPREPLVIVRPFIKSQVGLLVWNMKRWGTSKFFPCDSSSNVDIMFYYNRDLDQEPEIEEKLTSALDSNPAVRKCFRNVIFKSSKLKKVRDNHPDGPCWQFYGLFESPDLVDVYRYMFVMEPDVQVIRPFWLTRLLREVDFASFQDYWVKGSLSHCEGSYAFMDFHINGNALYKLGDSGFNRFMEDTWQYFLLSEQESRPGGCGGGMGGHDHAMFLYLTAEENYARVHKIFHKFAYSSFIVNYCIFEYRPWTTILRYPHAHFVHSSWANFRETWDRYAHDYMVSTDVEEEWNRAADVISLIEADARRASQVMAAM